MPYQWKNCIAKADADMDISVKTDWIHDPSMYN